MFIDLLFGAHAHKIFRVDEVDIINNRIRLHAESSNCLDILGNKYNFSHSFAKYYDLDLARDRILFCKDIVDKIH